MSTSRPGIASQSNNSGPDSVPSSRPFTDSLEDNLNELLDRLGESADVVVRKLDSEDVLPIALVYIDGLINVDIINQSILQPLTNTLLQYKGKESKESAAEHLRAKLLPITQFQECKTFESAFSMLFEGHTLVFIDGNKVALSMDTTGWQMRSINEPTSQAVVRGPKEGFTENLRTGTSLLRRKIKSPDLWIEEYKIGARTQTNIALVYMKGITDDQILKEVRSRLNGIQTDAILESNYIEEFIQDGKWTPFPTIQNSERPDAVAAGILEGQVALLIDGTPFALLTPATFFSFFQSSEDYYQRYDVASFLRLIRVVSFFVSMTLPALYIAITTFHQEMVPTPLLVSLAAQREGVPFPALVEALVMELTFDVLREAGVRMPRAIGPAVSIVGALVLGQAAVQAGLVSAAMVIVVSFTAICNFVIPSQVISNALRLIRFVMMIAASVLGLFGITSFLMFLMIHMAGLSSVGVPYLSPVAPMTPRYLKDVFVRAPHSLLKIRPKLAAKQEAYRQAQMSKENLEHDSSNKGGQSP
ncbi:spore germination protein [Paenibacillus physcomitrellae]|uniref:Spore germination protein KA n=1 Tax=Paenibacillus physcomitrellae TaxID=1619311 RepID=A0ABQ1GLS7_9BACL|nr:spore germination protein [Paenibacillus physcomitrellae]GGA46406.1 spore germination protein KA [Paenibacillus physcomitrellae]